VNQGTPRRPADPATTLAIPAAAATAWRRLAAELADTVPPCAHPDRRAWWWSDRPELVEAAIYHCRACPLLPACSDYADAANEQHGVWAGRDRAAPRRKVRRDRELVNQVSIIRRRSA